MPVSTRASPFATTTERVVEKQPEWNVQYMFMFTVHGLIEAEVHHPSSTLADLITARHNMGNVLSEEEQEERFIEDGFNLESPDADKVINYGTAAPVWQNKKSSSSRSLEHNNNNSTNDDSLHNSEGQEVVAATATNTASSTTNSEPTRETSTGNNDTSASTPATTEEPKKLSYIQMAKLGYQELINAIIRPPRADYKVRTTH